MYMYTEGVIVIWKNDFTFGVPRGERKLVVYVYLNSNYFLISWWFRFFATPLILTNLQSLRPSHARTAEGTGEGGEGECDGGRDRYCSLSYDDQSRFG